MLWRAASRLPRGRTKSPSLRPSTAAERTGRGSAVLPFHYRIRSRHSMQYGGRGEFCHHAARAVAKLLLTPIAFDSDPISRQTRDMTSGVRVLRGPGCVDPVDISDRAPACLGTVILATLAASRSFVAKARSSAVAIVVVSRLRPGPRRAPQLGKGRAHALSAAPFLCPPPPIGCSQHDLRNGEPVTASASW